MTKEEFAREKKAIKNAKKNEQSFEYLYRKYYPLINNFVYHRVRDEDTKNEIVSNVFYKAMKKINLFKLGGIHKKSFKSWLYRIAVNETNNYFRKRNKRKKIKNSLEKQVAIQKETNPWNFEKINFHMQKLSIYEQNLIALKYFEQLKHKEIAKIFKKKTSTIRVQVHRALKKLKNLLE